MTGRPFGTNRGGPGPDPGSEPDPIRVLVDEPPTPTAHRIGSQVILLILAMVLIVVLVVSGDDPEPAPPPDPGITVPIDGPTLDYQGRRYQLGRAGDLVVVRECDGVVLPWLLRPSTGELYRFDGWASQEFADAIRVREVHGATGLRVVKGAVCDQIHVEVAGGSEVVISG